MKISINLLIIFFSVLISVFSLILYIFYDFPFIFMIFLFPGLLLLRKKENVKRKNGYCRNCEEKINEMWKYCPICSLIID